MRRSTSPGSRLTLKNNDRSYFSSSGNEICGLCAYPEYSNLIGADMLELQNKVLERIAKGEPLTETVETLCRLVEARLPGIQCSVLRVENGVLHPLAAPSLPIARRGLQTRSVYSTSMFGSN